MLYQLIELEEDESAMGHLRHLLKQFQADDLVDVSKNNMVGFGSDGAKANLGKDHGLAYILFSGIFIKLPA